MKSRVWSGRSDALTFWAITASAVVAVTAYTLFLILNGRIGVSYQGDEGPRIFDAMQAARGYPWGLYPSLPAMLEQSFLGFHPPGDMTIKILEAQGAVLAGLSYIPARQLFFVCSTLLGVISLTLSAYISFRLAGLAAALLTLALMCASFVVVETRSTGMGEANFIPLLFVSFAFLAETVRSKATIRIWQIVAAGVAFLLATFMRPEGIFILPGLCLGLWYLIGFTRATLFGAIAGAFEIVKLANSTFNSDSVGLTLFNVGSMYFNPAMSFWAMLNTDFMRQMIHDPHVVATTLGLLAIIVFLVVGRRIALEAWRANLVLLTAAGSYLLVVMASQMLGLAPHASYRLAILPAHLLIPSAAISAVLLGRAWLDRAAPASRQHLLRLTSAGAVVLIAGWSAYMFLFVRMPAVEARQPPTVAAAMNFVMDRLQDGESFFPDRMRYWESSLIAWAADREEPACYYARCTFADGAARQLWNAAGKDGYVVGEISYGEFNALRMHTFIKEARPTYIMVANQSLWNSWFAVAQRVWGKDAETWASYVYPYLLEPLNFEAPQPKLFLRLGKIGGVDYFEDYVLLVPRMRNRSVMVFQAYYDRKPPELAPATTP